MSDKVTERAQGFLRPGEQVRRVVIAQGGLNPRLQIVFFMVAFIGARILSTATGMTGTAGIFMAALGGLAGPLVANVFITRRAVFVTDQGVVVLAYGRFGWVKPTRVIAQLPQGTRIGPMSGTWAQIELAGERLWVHKRWQGDAAAFTPAQLG